MAEWLRPCLRLRLAATIGLVDASLVGAGVGSNPTRNQIFLITFDLALDLGELDSSSIH